MKSDRDIMYELFEQSPGDLTAYGAIADLLDADGYQRLAHAFRWMSLRGVWPHKREYYNVCRRGFSCRGRKVPARHRWAWYGLSELCVPNTIIWGVCPQEKMILHALPKVILSEKQTVFRSHQSAVMWLADRLDALLAACSVNLPKKPGLPLIDVLTDQARTGNILEPPLLPEEPQ